MNADPYTVPDAALRRPPAGWRGRLRVLGPGIVISGSIVGSGELVLTSSLGAAAGFALLWWMLMSCWSKSIVQAELTRYVIVSGDTYLRALNRVPGRVPIGRTPVSWTLWLGLLIFVPGTVGMGGILGATGQSLAILFPGLDAYWGTVIATGTTAAILCSGSYPRLAFTMLILVAGFTLATVVAAFAMQSTGFQVGWAHIGSGLQFDLPVEHLVLALAVYGATGVNAAEISTYPYWCVEKGYAGFIGAGNDAARLERARGWIRVLHLDVWITLAILTCATLPFYLLGAGVLHAANLRPQGLDTVTTLSGMFTQTLGNWSLWLFGGAAFCILFSSAVAGFGGVSRFVPDYLVEFGLLERSRLETRRRWTRIVGGLLPLVSFLFYLHVPNPVTLLTIGALAGAVMLPVQSGATLWLHAHCLDVRLRPAPPARWFLWLTFLFQAGMAGLVLVFALR